MQNTQLEIKQIITYIYIYIYIFIKKQINITFHHIILIHIDFFELLIRRVNNSIVIHCSENPILIPRYPGKYGCVTRRRARSDTP